MDHEDRTLVGFHPPSSPSSVAPCVKNSAAPGIHGEISQAFLAFRSEVVHLRLQLLSRKKADVSENMGDWTSKNRWFVQMGVSENRLVPLNPMVLLIIIPFLNGYFIGNIPYFQTNPDVFMAKQGKKYETPIS